MKFIWTDFRRGLTEPTFVGAVSVALMVLFVSLGYYMLTQESYEATQAFIMSQSLILPFIAPLLASLPYSNMNMLEKDSGYTRFLHTKGERKNYDKERFFTNGIIGGITLVLPLLVFLGICRVFSPYTQLEAIISVLLLDFMFGFSYATIAYGLTFVNTKRYIPVVAPQVIYLLFIYAFPYLGLDEFYPPISFSPWLLPSKAIAENILVQFGGLIGVTLLLIMGSKLYHGLLQKSNEKSRG